MSDIDVFQKMSEIAATPQFAMVFGDDNELTRKVVEHREWLKSIRHERPSPEIPFKVGIYIRYFNQTRYENYLEFHKKQLLLRSVPTGHWWTSILTKVLLLPRWKQHRPGVSC